MMRARKGDIFLNKLLEGFLMMTTVLCHFKKRHAAPVEMKALYRTLIASTVREQRPK